MRFRFVSLVILVLNLFMSGCINDPTGSDTLVSQTSVLPGMVMRSSTFAATVDCPAGGVLIEMGTDTNKDGQLQTSEVDTSLSQRICNGVNGADGADGVDGINGVDGVDGINGVDGVDGLGAIIEIETELPGGNCEYGGSKITSGIYDASGEIVEGSERTHYICRATPDCTWMDNSDGTITVTCLGEEPYLLLSQAALEFTETIRCSVSIPKAGSPEIDIPLSYTVDKIGHSLKHVTLTVFDGASQFTNSRLLSSGQEVIFELAFISVSYDNFGSESGGRFYALLSEDEATVSFIYEDEDLESANNVNGLIGGDFPVGSVCSVFN